MTSSVQASNNGNWCIVKEQVNEDRSRKALSRRLKDKYERACKAANKYPLKCVLHQLENTDMDLAGKKIGPVQMRLLAITILEDDSIATLDLRDNVLGDKGIFLLTDILPHNMYITQLNLAENSIGIPGLKAVKQSIVENILMTKIDLSGNEITDEGAKVLAAVLEAKTGLLELTANHNCIGEMGAEAIGNALAHNEVLEILDLSWNHIRCKGAIAIAHSLKTNNCLRSLDVAWNGFGREGARALGEALPENTRLQNLDVTNNRIEANGMAMFMVGLRTNETLQSLKLGKNPFNSDVGKHLLLILEANDKSALSNLELSDISVDEDFAAVLDRLAGSRDFNICHGKVVRKIPEKEYVPPPLPPRDPLELMFEFKYENGYRTLDLLMRMDKDNNMVVDREEFKTGLLEMDIEANDDQIDDLMAKLDLNSDGSIDYSEFIQGEKEYGNRHKRQMNMETVQKIRSLAAFMLKLKMRTQMKDKGVTDSGTKDIEHYQAETYASISGSKFKNTKLDK